MNAVFRILGPAVIFSVAVFLQAVNTFGQNIQVNPTGVNVNSQGSTVVFLTFGSLLSTQVPAEGCWCGELVSAAPNIGFTCDPARIFGCLPSRFNLSTRSGIGSRGLTDIMSIPPSVARRAYQAAVDGDTSSFFYVRRFINTAGGPDEFVNVTCRMSGGGPRSPFALTDVKLSFAVDKPIMLLKVDEKVPPVQAVIAYNGTGRLKGRWEVVLPGEDPPTETDLLTEATLPIEERARQRRYTQLSTFNVFLAPAGKYTLPGPDVSRLPNSVSGEYLLLLRIEASDEKEGDSNLAAVGVGLGVVHSGAVSGFPLPVLRYYIGSGPDAQLTNDLTLLLPADRVFLSVAETLEFSWSEIPAADFYRLEIVDMSGRGLLSAVLVPGKEFYRAPPWLNEKVGAGNVRWRVIALDRAGKTMSESKWRDLRLTQIK
ncbi:MAG TPA: hypothetical protein VFD63_21175 [Pyrinomonadaceae bacterium]|nr:hypothetical protein [Pyrinomonadaceae bacterium]